jgi:hypothetical protein
VQTVSANNQLVSVDLKSVECTVAYANVDRAHPHRGWVEVSTYDEAVRIKQHLDGREWRGHSIRVELVGIPYYLDILWYSMSVIWSIKPHLRVSEEQ